MSDLAVLDVLMDTADGAFAVDREGIILRWNRAAERMTGRKARDVIGRPCFEVMCGRDSSGNLVCFKGCLVQAMALRGERPSSYDLVVSPSNGKKMWLNVSIVLVRDELGGVGVAVHLFRDVTERRRLESYLQRALGERMAAFGDASSDGLDLLTSRERQVLELLASGFPAHVIAHRLSISQATVRNHTQNILNKLGVHSKLAAVALAYRHGLAP